MTVTLSTREKNSTRRTCKLQPFNTPERKIVSHNVFRGGERKQRKYKKEVDTNVVDIKFSVLQDQGVLGTGDPLFCQVCQSVFNMYS